MDIERDPTRAVIRIGDPLTSEQQSRVIALAQDIANIIGLPLPEWNEPQRPVVASKNGNTTDERGPVTVESSWSQIAARAMEMVILLEEEAARLRVAIANPSKRPRGRPRKKTCDVSRDGGSTDETVPRDSSVGGTRELSEEGRSKLPILAGDIGSFIGITPQLWNQPDRLFSAPPEFSATTDSGLCAVETPWSRVAMLASGKVILLQDLVARLERMIADPPRARPGRPIADAVHERDSRRERRFIPGIGPISLDEAKELLDAADRHPSDAAFARWYSRECNWAKGERAINLDRSRRDSAIRQLETFAGHHLDAAGSYPDIISAENALRRGLIKAISRYRKEFKRPRKRGHKS